MNTKPLCRTGRKLAVILGLMTMTAAQVQSAVEAWVRRYSHPLGSDDYAQKVVTDNAGNLIVAGDTDDGINGDDFLIIKYSSAGVLLWTNRYDGPANHPANQDDQVTGVAVDGSGKVFVTGRSPGGGSDLDYATVAYSAAGAPLWTNRFNGPGNGIDQPAAVAVDGSGNVFVTGGSWNGTSEDFATAAYTGAGVPLWTNFCSGSADSGDGARAMAVDSSGNVFVTGFTWNRSASDYLTVAYTGAGAALWTNQYNGPGNGDDAVSAIAVDGSGNVFVTGASSSGSSYDYATVAYSAGGEPWWTRRYNGPPSYDDYPSAIAVDSGGNVFVTGYSAGTNGEGDYATVAYTGVGIAIWTNRYDGPENYSDGAYAIAVDNSGNVFVTGAESDSDGGNDYATVAYSRAGVALCTNRYNGPGTGVRSDIAQAMALDGSGNVFVTGFSYGSSGGVDYLTLAYSGEGVALWTNRYDGPGSFDVAHALAVDSSGNVFVTGQSDSSADHDDYVTVAYSAAGVALWTNRFSGPGIGDDVATDLALDGSGNVFVTGYSYGSGGANDYATVAYSGVGVPLWTNRYNGPANSFDAGIAIAVDGSGNVFVTGYSYGKCGQDYATIKYWGVRPYLTIEPDDAGGYFLRFNGVPSEAYRFQRTANISAPWDTIAILTTPSSGLAEYHDAKPLAGQAFYRVRED